MKLKNALLFAAVIGFFICALLFIYYPAFPRSVLGWLALVFIGLPVWFYLEWLGEHVFGLTFFTKLSSPARIVIVIPFVIALIVVSIFLVQLVQKFVSIS